MADLSITVPSEKFDAMVSEIQDIVVEGGEAVTESQAEHAARKWLEDMVAAFVEDPAYYGFSCTRLTIKRISEYF